MAVDQKKLRPRHTSRVASLLAYRAKLLAPSPASTLSSTNLHLITFCPASPGWIFSRLFFPTDKSLLCAKVAERLVSICGTRFLVSFSSVLLFPSSFFFSTRHPVLLFPCPVPLVSRPQPPQKRCKLSQGPHLPTTYSFLSTRLDSTRLGSVYFQHLSTPPLEAHLLVWSFVFTPSVF